MTKMITIQEHKKNILAIISKLVKGEGSAFNDYKKIITRVVSEIEEESERMNDFAAGILSLRMFLELIINSAIPTVQRISGDIEEENGEGNEDGEENEENEAERREVVRYLKKIMQNTEIAVN